MRAEPVEQRFAADAERAARDGALEGEDGDVGLARADVDDEVGPWRGDGNTRAHGGGDGGVDQVHRARACARRGFENRATVIPAHAGANRDHKVGLEDSLTAGGTVDGVLHQRCQRAAVGDVAPLQRPAQLEPVVDGRRFDGGGAEKAENRLALLDGDDGRFGENRALAARDHARRRGAEVDSELLPEHAVGPSRRRRR